MTNKKAIKKGLSMYNKLNDIMDGCSRGNEESIFDEPFAELKEYLKSKNISYKWEARFNVSDKVYFEIKHWDYYNYYVGLFEGEKPIIRNETTNCP